MKHVDVALPNGKTLSVDYTDAFIEKVRSAFDVPIGTQVTDEHIRMFVHTAMKNAIDKHEAEENVKTG